MGSAVVQINDKIEHDEAVAQSKDVPTVIYVSNSSLPVCERFTPKYETLATQWLETGIKFCQMDFNHKTSMLFKFSPNQLPVTILTVRDAWCKTVMGADMPALEIALGQLLDQSKQQ